MPQQKFIELRAGLENEDKEQVLGLTDPVTDAISEQRSVERAFDKVAQLVRANAPRNSDARNAADTYLESVTESEEGRAAATRAAIGYITGELSAEAASAMVGPAIAAERRLSSAMDELRATKDEVPMPAVLLVRGPSRIEVPKGNGISQAITVENHGGGSAPHTEIVLEADIDVELSPQRPKGLEPDESTTVELHGNPRRSGVSTIQLSAISGRISDSLSIEVIVANKTDYLRQTIRQIQDLREDVEALQKRQPGKKGKGSIQGRLNGVEKKLDVIEDRLARIIERARRAKINEEAIDKKIGSVIKIAEATINQLEGMKKNPHDTSQFTLLILDVEQITMTLRTGQDAEL